ncbi:MAG TPA: hypothetical protein VMS78_10710 [Rhizomicrobium sp.]|nr:hypothetical protein [Rhizomicrobium sp.]
MSELISTSGRGKQALWQLLSTASALVLIGAMTQAKAADDEDRPTVWIELGGSLQRVDTSEEKYAPPFLFGEKRPDPETVDPLSVGHLPRSAFDGEGKITFQPGGSSWDFTVAAKFGRSEAHQHLHQQSSATGPIAGEGLPGFSPIYQHVFQFIDAKKDSSESHAILDFQVGKDVGFGMFGSGSTSVFSAGVRFAQFDARSSTSFASDPDAKLHIKYFTIIPHYITVPQVTNAVYHINQGSSWASRSFHGIGPALSWNGSAPVIGNARDGEVVLDFGVNAAVLFGRQKAKTHHQSTARYHHGKYYNIVADPTHPDPGHDFSRSKMVTVPNVGAFAGLTYQIQNFKISAGYRADFFFGAMDGGIDTRKSEDEKFYGPFATISLGLGG